jgi:ACR3 family arsenite efflux pump ArsB
MEGFILRQLSRFPVFLWTDLSHANVMVAGVAVITSHVIELVSRSGVLKMIVCNTSEKDPALPQRSPYGEVKEVCCV